MKIDRTNKKSVVIDVTSSMSIITTPKQVRCVYKDKRRNDRWGFTYIGKTERVVNLQRLYKAVRLAMYEQARMK